MKRLVVALLLTGLLGACGKTVDYNQLQAGQGHCLDKDVARLELPPCQP